MIETERLILKPLTLEQLIKYLRDDYSLEMDLNLRPMKRTISPALKEAMEQTIIPNVSDTTKNYLFSTLWTVISKVDNQMVGDICIVGEPDCKGAIEIGYGTHPEFRNKGYMTEAVGCIIHWAKTEPNVKSVNASTDKSNKASSIVLVRNGFVKIGETEAMFSWQRLIK